MAHAIRFHQTGGPEVLQLETVEVGEPGPGQARVRHRFVAVNFIDIYFRSGRYPHPLPAGLGSDAVIGVTAGEQKATSARIPSLVAGTLIVRNAPIVFSVLQIFDHWRLNSEPALTIGMDVLGVLDTLVIDCRRGELHVKSRS